MRGYNASLVGLKIKLSVSSFTKLLQNYKYSVFALTVAVVFFEFMYWAFNFDVFRVIMLSSNVSFTEKINVLLSPIEAIGAASGIHVVTMMIVLSVLQGINIAALTYIIRHQQKVDSKLLGGGSFVGILALIGLGCPACGTSLLTPLIAVFVSGSAVAIAEQITLIALPFAIAMSLYGMYVLGQRLATVRAQQKATSPQA